MILFKKAFAIVAYIGSTKLVATMPKKSDIPLVKRTLNLREGDQEVIERAFPRHKYSSVIRHIVMNVVDSIRAQPTDPATFQVDITELTE